jgi:hypothetical protein
MVYFVTSTKVDPMLALFAKRLAPAFVVVATLSLSGVTSSSPATAQTATAAQAEHSDAVLAALDYMQATRFRSRSEAKFAALIPNKMRLKIALQRLPVLENELAKIYAARFTAEELREASKFYRTVAGALYFDFNIEMNANPYTTAETYRSEAAKRFSSSQRAEVFAYLQTDIGQKMIRMVPDVVKASKEAGEQWDRQTQEAIGRAVRTGGDVS